MAEFSVLLPVYAGDKPDWVKAAFDSVTSEQELPPTEVVIVRDGPVGPELQRTLDELREHSPVQVQYVPLEQNVRLARALQEGLKHCSHDVVARADADDICLPHRFSTQIPAMENLDLLGSAVQEFSDDIEHLKAAKVRRRPLSQQEIEDYARVHNPFNHPSVVFRKAAVARAGGYQDLPFLEDYWLFLRMLVSGARVGNLPEALVRYRVDRDLFRRRGGWAAIRSELYLQRSLRKLGFLSRPQLLRNLVTRIGYRLVPGKLRAWAYERFVRAPESERF